MQVVIDQPMAEAPCDPLCFRVEGWATPAPEGVPACAEVWLDERCVGRSTEWFVRPDVNQTYAWSGGTRAGYSVMVHSSEGPFGRAAELRVRIVHGGRTVGEAQRLLRFNAYDHRTAPFGILLRSDFPPVHHREHIYTSGPSHETGSHEALERVVRFLGPPPCSVLDVGCGLGWYGRQLLGMGYRWQGAEMKPDDCAALAAAGLPFERIDGNRLPQPDRSCDVALAIEVLEHVRDLNGFLTETARVAPGGLFISVPNAELLAYLSPYKAIPWHMLEADHHNFFTRASLTALLREYYADVEVSAYAEHPLRTAEGSPLYYHLCATARHARQVL